MLATLTNQENPLSLLFSFQNDPYFFFDRVKPKNTHKIKKLRLGIKDFYFCYHPDHAKHILHDNKENYPKSSLVLKKILPLSGPKGLIQLSDKDAKAVRQSAGTLMHPEKAERLSEYVEGFVREEFEKLDLAAAENSVVDLKPFLTQLVLRTAGVFILNHDVQSNAEKLNHSFVELNRMAGESLRSLIPMPFSYKRSKYLRTIHTELDKVIEERLRTPETSLLHELNQRGFSRAFIRDQVKAFMFAGYDTTASSLIFAVDSIARSPEAQEKISIEKDQKYKAALYTQAAYKESLRLYPSAYFLPRQAAADDTVFGETIKAGSQVFISIRHVHRCTDVYDSPNSFMPERFLEKQKHSYAFIPFGGGPRICIGAPLAMMEATVVLQKLCERYKIQAVSNEPPEIEGLITAHTKSPLYVKLEKRASC
jgi:cytochrome P450